MEDLGETLIIYFILLIAVCIISYPLLGYFAQYGEVAAVLYTSLTAFLIHTTCLAAIFVYDSKEWDYALGVFMYNIFIFFFFYLLGMVFLEWLIRTVSQLPFI